MLSTSLALWTWAQEITHWLKSGALIGLTPEQVCWSANENIPVPVAAPVWFKWISRHLIYFFKKITLKSSPLPRDCPRKCCICTRKYMLTPPGGLPKPEMAVKKNIKHLFTLPKGEERFHTRSSTRSAPVLHRTTLLPASRGLVNAAFKVHMNRQKFWSFKKKLLVT